MQATMQRQRAAVTAGERNLTAMQRELFATSTPEGRPQRFPSLSSRSFQLLPPIGAERQVAMDLEKVNAANAQQVRDALEAARQAALDPEWQRDYKKRIDRILGRGEWEKKAGRAPTAKCPNVMYSSTGQPECRCDDRDCSTQQARQRVERNVATQRLQPSLAGPVATTERAVIGPQTGPKVKPQVKEYCDHWIHYGKCAYTQIGCRFKHIMPMDRPTQLKLGLESGLPKWYVRQQRGAQGRRGRQQATQGSPLRAEATAFEPTTQLSTIVEEERGESSTAFGSSNSPSLAAAAPAFAPTSPLNAHAQPFTPATVQPVPAVVGTENARVQPFTPTTAPVAVVPAVVVTDTTADANEQAAIQEEIAGLKLEWAAIVRGNHRA